MFWLKNILYSLSFVVFIVGPSSSLSNFRPDYTYNRKVGAFYKFHIEAEFFERAKTICNSEGASIMIPTTEWDITIAHGMYKKYPDIDEYAWIGIDGKIHDSAEENEPITQYQTLEETGYSQWSKNEPNNYGGDEYCGSIFKNDGKYNDLCCSHYYGFVCEKEVNK